MSTIESVLYYQQEHPTKKLFTKTVNIDGYQIDCTVSLTNAPKAEHWSKHLAIVPSIPIMTKIIKHFRANKLRYNTYMYMMYVHHVCIVS